MSSTGNCTFPTLGEFGGFGAEETPPLPLQRRRATLPEIRGGGGDAGESREFEEWSSVRWASADHERACCDEFRALPMDQADIEDEEEVAKGSLKESQEEFQEDADEGRLFS